MKQVTATRPDPACPICDTPWAWIKDTEDLKHGGHWAACCGCEGLEEVDITIPEVKIETETN